MKNLKTTMIAALLMLAAVGGVAAQDKWEYASIQYSYAGSKGCAMRITIGEKSFEEIFVPKESYENWWGMDLRPVFKKRLMKWRDGSYLVLQL
jgi:hypothetical protein